MDLAEPFRTPPDRAWPTRWIDFGTTATVVITGLLFIVALFLKGISHDLFLESAVLLVSVKLILLGTKNRLAMESLHRELREIKALLQVRRTEP